MIRPPRLKSSLKRNIASTTLSKSEWKKSQNGDTLSPLELNVGLEQGDQGDQGDRREQVDQGEVSIIIFGMSGSLGFQKYSISWVFQALFCVFVFVVVFVIVFVFVFVFSDDF